MFFCNFLLSLVTSIYFLVTIYIIKIKEGEEMETLATRLKQLRLEKGLTLEQVAKELNTTKVTISRYENSAREPKSDTLRQLAHYFDVSIDYLLGDSDERKIITDDEKEIQVILEETRKKLENNEGLMFDGELLDKEDIESLLQAMEIGLAMVQKKIKNKK
jgi:transcriptional regulator with XRE-family HTH domain